MLKKINKINRNELFKHPVEEIRRQCVLAFMQVEGLDISFSAHKNNTKKSGIEGERGGSVSNHQKNSCTANTAENKKVI